MAQEKIKIGYDVNNKVNVYLIKHEFCCDTHWVFGWVDSKDYHTHLENYKIDFGFHPDSVTLLYGNNKIEITEIEPNIFGNVFDLYKQAYALESVRAIYGRGHGGITENKYGLKRDEEEADKLNKQIEEILDIAWTLLEKAQIKKQD